MAKNRENRYYKRNGSQSLPMEHFEIADMFGRRRRPLLRILHSLSSGSIQTWGGGSSRTVVVTLHVENAGRGSASAPYLNVQVAEPFRLTPHGISLPIAPSVPTPPLMPQTTQASGLLARCFAGRADFVIHPRVSYPVAWIQADISDDVPTFPDLVVVYALAAENFPMVTGEVRVAGADLIATVRPEP